MLGILTGLRQEARLIARMMPGVPIALSHANEAQAYEAVERLRAAGVTEILSFGCAGGLAPSLHPGVILVADRVRVDEDVYPTHASLSERFGAAGAMRGDILHSPTMVQHARDKEALYRKTGCLAVDMESGVVARSGISFAVLRVVCDDAGRDLPPAATESLRNGRIYWPGLVRSLGRHPGQVPSLIGMGRDASLARRAMEAFLHQIII